MKKIIKGRLYDTDTAKEIAADGNGLSPRDFRSYSETLYLKRTGEYFLCGEGGPMTKYARRYCDGNGLIGGSGIIPLTAEEAREWGEKHMSADDYIAAFGPVEE